MVVLLPPSGTGHRGLTLTLTLALTLFFTLMSQAIEASIAPAAGNTSGNEWFLTRTVLAPSPPDPDQTEPPQTLSPLVRT